MGRGVAHFYAVGALVNHEPFVDPWVELSRQWYERLESQGPVKAKSSAIMKFVREQWVRHLPQFAEKKTKGTKRAKGVQAVVGNKKAKVAQVEVAKSEVAKSEDVPKAQKGKRAKNKTEAEEVRAPKKGKVYAVPEPLMKEGAALPIEEIKVDPFGVLEGALFTQIPCGQKCPAKVGVWRLPGDAWEGRRVFLKGPENRERSLTQWWFMQIKSVMGGSADGIPLRPVATRVMQYGVKFFILMEDLSAGSATKPAVKRGEPIVILKSGEEEGASKIFQEYLRLKEGAWESIPEAMVKEYLAILLFRQVLGASDTCHRNILQKGSALWSVDESVSGKPLTVWVAHLSHKFQRQLKAWFQQHRQWCLDLVARWRAVDLSQWVNRSIEDRLAYVEAKIME
jgi:hypothetical protein